MLGTSLLRGTANPAPPIVLRSHQCCEALAGGRATHGSVMARCRGQVGAWAQGLGRMAGPARRAALRKESADLPESADDQKDVAAFFISAALGFSVAIGISEPALAKYKDNVVQRLWTYEEPDAWNVVSPVCSAGSNQSPVDLNDQKSLVETPQVPLNERVFYQPANGVEAFNANNRTYQVQGNFGKLSLPDGDYSANQFHFHFPAEHLINGKQYDGELHIVHFKPSNKAVTGRLVDIAVVGIPLEIVPEPDTGPLGQLERMFDSKSEIRQEELELLKSVGLEAPIPPNGKTVGIKDTIDLNVFKNALNGEFFHYVGSLTTPPCTEKVHWYVTEKPAPVTRKMIDYWKETLPKNTSRPLQKMYRRKAVKGALDVPGEFIPPTPPPAPSDSTQPAPVQGKSASQSDSTQPAPVQGKSASQSDSTQPAPVQGKSASQSDSTKPAPVQGKSASQSDSTKPPPVQSGSASQSGSA
eukprot:TRINITY_DN3669_c0_g1_i1.p1 TRINITY_DN3669_c0_g1~~TRINITY_DN3669_c0_g1_i1.p1  ORF type:complete len:471 (+),score=69.02 TRINITY_DN3669_c0_g1_i1:85-1497(+)